MNDVILPHRHAHRRRLAHALGAIIALIMGGMIVGGSQKLAALVPVQPQTLGACVRNVTLFPNTLGKSKNIVDAWSIDYGNRVRTVIDEDLAFLENGGSCQQDDSRPPAEPELQKLAKQLPAWKEKTQVSQEDMDSILVDYLQEYECALQERSVVLEAAIYYDFVATKTDSSSSVTGKSLGFDDYEDEISTQSQRIGEEKIIAREALDRTLLYRSGYSRTWQLKHSLQCVNGAMLDIRNALSLAADASACMPKIWDVQTFLRSIKTK